MASNPTKKAVRSRRIVPAAGEMVKVRVSGEVMTLPVSILASQSTDIIQNMGPTTEAIVTNNNKTMGVFMTVERRNALAEAEDKLQEALLQLDLLAANRTQSDLDRSASEVRQRKGMSLKALREKLQAERESEG